MKVVLQPHLKIRLKQRLIPQTYPKKIIAEADSQYYDSLSHHQIATTKLKVEGGKNMKKLIKQFTMIKRLTFYGS